MIEDKTRAIAADNSGVVEAAVVAHSEGSDGQAADSLLLHRQQRPPPQLGNRCGSWALLKEVRDGGGKLLQAGLVSVNTDAALFVIDEERTAISSLLLLE